MCLGKYLELPDMTFFILAFLDKHWFYIMDEITLKLITLNFSALPGGSLNISQARREDAGTYKVKATNSEGKTVFKFKLDVHYPPK